MGELISSAIMMNRFAFKEGACQLYSNGSPVLTPTNDPTAALLQFVNSQNLFQFFPGNPTLASTTTVYKAWLFDKPDLSSKWAILLPDGQLKECQFLRYEIQAVLYIAYFTHTN